MEMETDNCKRTLPDELVERIISMLPFPSIAKARCLSKSWIAKFSPVSTLDDALVKRKAVMFQKGVQERAANWSTFFPVCLDRDFLCGYDQVSQKWISFPSLSFLPKGFWANGTHRWTEGVLLYGMDWKNKSLYVANIITRSWRSVDLLPVTQNGIICLPVSMWEASSETYQVIYLQAAVGWPSFRLWSAEIYESKADMWCTKRLVDGQIPAQSPVYLDGVLYMLAQEKLLCVLALSMVEEGAAAELGTVEELELSFNGEIEEFASAHLVVCNVRLYMVVMTVHDGVIVLEVDVDSLRLLEINRGPCSLSTEALFVEIDKEEEPVSDDDFIFFCAKDVDTSGTCGIEIVGRKLRHQMVAFDVQRQEWVILDCGSPTSAGFKWKGRPRLSQHFKWIRCSFQPGLNPFAEV